MLGPSRSQLADPCATHPLVREAPGAPPQHTIPTGRSEDRPGHGNLLPLQPSRGQQGALGVSAGRGSECGRPGLCAGGRLAFCSLTPFARQGSPRHPPSCIWTLGEADWWTQRPSPSQDLPLVQRLQARCSTVSSSPCKETVTRLSQRDDIESPALCPRREGAWDRRGFRTPLQPRPPGLLPGS